MQPNLFPPAWTAPLLLLIDIFLNQSFEGQQLPFAQMIENLPSTVATLLCSPDCAPSSFKALDLRRLLEQILDPTNKRIMHRVDIWSPPPHLIAVNVALVVEKNDFILQILLSVKKVTECLTRRFAATTIIAVRALHDQSKLLQTLCIK